MCWDWDDTSLIRSGAGPGSTEALLRRCITRRQSAYKGAGCDGRETRAHCESEFCRVKATSWEKQGGIFGRNGTRTVSPLSSTLTGCNLYWQSASTFYFWLIKIRHPDLTDRKKVSERENVKENCSRSIFLFVTNEYVYCVSMKHFSDLLSWNPQQPLVKQAV